MRLTSALCVGALGLALLGSVAAAAPAAAAPAPTAARQQGPLVFQASWSSTSYFGYQLDSDGYVRSLGPNLGESKGAAIARAVTATFPAPGTSGPIMVGDRCLAAQSTFMWAVTCTGSSSQNFSWQDGGPVLTSGGLKLGTLWGPAVRSLALITVPGSTKDWLQVDSSTLPKPAVPVDVTTPPDGATIDTRRPTFGGTGDPNAEIVLRDEKNTVVGSTTVKSDGTWSVPAAVDLADGVRTVTATQTASDKTVTTDSTRFTVVSVTPVDITEPANNSTVETKRPTFAGTGQPDATVVVKDQDGRTLGTTTVEADGTWSVVSEIDLEDRVYTATATQTTKSGNVSTDDTCFAVVDNGDDSPIANPAMTGGAVVLASGAVLLYRRRRA